MANGFYIVPKRKMLAPDDPSVINIIQQTQEGNTYYTDWRADFPYRLQIPVLVDGYDASVTQKYECYRVSDNYYGVDDTLWISQEFTPATTHLITKVILLLYKVGDPGTVTVSITASDSQNRPTGSDLASVSFAGSTLTTNTNGEEKTCAFTTPYEITGKTHYNIVVKATAATATPQTNYVAVRRDAGGSTYARGEAHYYAGTDWYESDGQDDFFFEEWGTTDYNKGFVWIE